MPDRVSFRQDASAYADRGLLRLLLLPRARTKRKATHSEYLRISLE
jgi:hypothetical protein